MKIYLRRYNRRTRKTDVEEVEVTCIDIETERGTFFINMNEDESLNIGDNVTVTPGPDETINVQL